MSPASAGCRSSVSVRIWYVLPRPSRVWDRKPLCSRSAMIFWTARSVSLHRAAMSRTRMVWSSAMAASTRAWFVMNVHPACDCDAPAMPQSYAFQFVHLNT